MTTKELSASAKKIFPSKGLDPEVKLAASILGADPLNLERDLKRCEETGLVPWVQVDVMDGRFAANLSFGPDTVSAISQRHSLFIDIHLMVERPKNLLETFAQKGADLLTIHAEAKDSPKECLRLIRRLGKYAGLAVRPKTPLKKILHLLPEIDLLLIMTVEPGFAGQKFIDRCIPKIAQAREWSQKHRNRLSWIEVDGGIGESTIPPVVKAGANMLVCGSSLFRDLPSTTAPRLYNAAQGAKNIVK